MGRGRRALPDEVKALKGNPDKRRLALDGAGTEAVRPKRTKIDPADYLTQEAERVAFSMAVATLPANVVRASDVNVMARWATWLNIWVTCKAKLDGKAHWYESKTNHGNFLREHPLAKRMSQAEMHLIALEDRLGLNPVARQAIIRALAGMMPATVVAEEEQPISEAPPANDASPLAYLQQAGKLN